MPGSPYLNPRCEKLGKDYTNLYGSSSSFHTPEKRKKKFELILSFIQGWGRGEGGEGFCAGENAMQCTYIHRILLPDPPFLFLLELVI